MAIPKGPVPIPLTLARWGAHGLPRGVGKADNICVVWLCQVSRRRNLGVPPSARVFAARPAHEGMLPTRSVQVLRRQRGPVVGVFKSFFPGPVQRVGVSSPSPVGQSGDWSVEVLHLSDAVQRLGADPSRLLDTRPLAGVDRSCRRAAGAERLIPLRSQGRLRRRRVLLAAPQPEPKPSRGQHAPANVNNNSVKEVMNRNNAASRIFPSSGYICGAADALRPTLTLPLERLNDSGAPYHAAA